LHLTFCYANNSTTHTAAAHEDSHLNIVARAGPVCVKVNTGENCSEEGLAKLVEAITESAGKLAVTYTTVTANATQSVVLSVLLGLAPVAAVTGATI
jgi:hypothetical protein